MAVSRLFLDTETFSSVPISCGTHAYVDSPDFEVIIATWAWDDEPVQAIEHPTPEFLQDLIDRADEVVIHNSTFDRLALRRIGVKLPLEKIHDTMVRALMHSLPGALDKLCDILRVPVDKAKDKDGKRLIHRFTKPQPKNQKIRRRTKETDPEDWAAFLVYAGLDVDAMREVFKRIPFWNWKPDEIELWRLDQVINDRGVQIDLDLADAALRTFERNKERLSVEVRALTVDELQSTTQRDLTLAYVRRLGLDLPDMKGGTIETALKQDNVPEDAKVILENRLQSAATSPAKYRVLQRATSADGRLRNVLQFCGAMRTGRWGGRLFQPQNLPRPALIGLHEEALQLEIDFAIQAMKADVADVFYDDVTEACTAAVRGSIIAAPDTKLVVADLSNIEGRKLSWLAREEWKLKAFRDYDAGRGPDIYKVTAAAILGKKVEDVTKDERQGQGKVPELACGYQGSVGAFTTMGAIYGLFLPEDEVLTIVRGWRGRHPNTVNLWYDTERAAISAVRDPGTVYRAGRLAFHFEKGWLRMRLPSGRYLCYPQAEVGGGRHVCDKCEGRGSVLVGGWQGEADPKPAHREVCNWCDGTGIIDLGKPYLSYMGVDQYTKQWKRLATYGGKLIENACIAQGTPVLTDEGWVPIEQVRRSQRVWDGEAWVSHEGLAPKGVKEVISSHGVLMTSDHEVLTVEGWKRGSEAGRFERAACRLPDGCPEAPHRPQSGVACALRLRRRERDGRQRVQEAGQARRGSFLRLPEEGFHRGEEHETRGLPHAALRGLEVHERPLQAAFAPVLAQLRRAWDHGLRTLAHFVCGFFGGCGSELPARAVAGPSGQQRRLHPGEFPVGDACGIRAQHPVEPHYRHAVGPDDSGRGVGTIRDRRDDVALPFGRRTRESPAVRGSGLQQPVYDLINCGPRHRFTVASDDGRPLIVHNCQASCRDILAHGIKLAEAAGYRVVLHIHDELICEVPDSPEYSAEGLAALMTTLPEWAAGLPLAAAGYESYRYRKD